MLTILVALGAVVPQRPHDLPDRVDARDDPFNDDPMVAAAVFLRRVAASTISIIANVADMASL